MSSLIIQAFLDTEEVTIGNCTWINTFDNDERNSYHRGLVITGVISQILTLWLNLSLMLTSLWKDDDYRHLALFTVVTCLRKLAAGMVSLPSFRFIDSWFKSNLLSCVMFAYHDSFFSVLEIEGLTHVCIARYVMARYAANGWPMEKRYIFLFICSTLGFAFVYTYIPMFGFGGSFYYDFSCTTCTFEMILPNNHQRYIVLTLFFLKSIKPALMMVGMLAWANYLDKNVCIDNEANKRLKFTRNIMVITAVTLICWAPLAVIRGYVIIGQLVSDKADIINSMTGYGTPIKWAILLYWVSPTFVVIALMIMDKNILHNMIHLRACAKMAAELADKEAEEKENEEKQQLKEKEKDKGKKKQ